MMLKTSMAAETTASTNRRTRGRYANLVLGNQNCGKERLMKRFKKASLVVLLFAAMVAAFSLLSAASAVWGN